MVAAEDGIGLFTETLTRLIDRGVVFRLLNTWRAVLQHTLVWQANKNSEALLAFQKILRRQPGHKSAIRNQVAGAIARSRRSRPSPDRRSK
jgi:hypothetical protein